MGVKMISTKNLSRMEWLELRRRGIGGSDASVIAGKNPWKSVLQLWEEKTGKTELVDTGNEYTYWGNVMESIIRKEFMNRTGLKVRQKHFMIFHSKYPYMFADVDGIVTDEHGEKCIFEAKTVSQYREKEWKDGHIPEEYMLQVQHYLEVCGMKKAYIAALIGGNHFIYHVIERDEEMIAELLRVEEQFWMYHVKQDICPKADDSDATKEYLQQKYEYSVSDCVELDNSIEGILQDYQKIDDQIKAMEKQKTGLSNQLKAALGEHEAGLTGAGKIVRWKRIEKTALDSKKLKEEQPEIYSRYSSISAYRRLSIA